jgi:hypothetical protein
MFYKLEEACCAKTVDGMPESYVSEGLALTRAGTMKAVAPSERGHSWLHPAAPEHGLRYTKKLAIVNNMNILRTLAVRRPHPCTFIEKCPAESSHSPSAVGPPALALRAA